jgi:hypothetical protein
MSDSYNGDFSDIVTRMNRIRDLSKDLSREFERTTHSAEMTRSVVAAIKADTDAVWLAVSAKKH